MNSALQLVWLIPLLPLAGFLINGLGRNYLSKTMTGIIGSGVIFISFLLSAWASFSIKDGVAPIHYFDFINVTGLKIGFDFQVDQLSCIFLLIITGVGFLIHLYSTSYMHDEAPKDFAKYFSFLNLFVFSMLLLVMGANYLIMFIGWEGVGLCSYLLIGFWFTNNNYNNAARKAFIMNRIGDLGFLLAIFWIANKLGSVDFHTVFANVSDPAKFTTFDITGITLLLFVGATGKSAQIPLYTWLPDAMAGPTPVSALIHAATMVTAGIYMIARSNILYTMAPVTQTVVAVVGLATAILAATIALKQNDIKKVLAYSTVSQLGYMFLGLGVGAYTGAVFHVMTHAFFKALLFLGAGSVIHAMSGEQDIRNMGGLKKYMSITHITFLLGCLAIAGMPPFSGFFSKDEILGAAFEKNPLYYGIGVVGAMMTAFYMFRLYAMTFLGEFRGTADQQHHLHESPKAMTIPLVILAVLAVVGGLIGIPEIFVPGGHRLEAYLAPIFAQSNAKLEKGGMAQSTEILLMAISVVAALFALLYAWNKFIRYKKSMEEEKGLGKVLENKWYVDEFYDAVIVKPVNAIAKYFNNVFERKGIDGFVNGIGRAVNYSSRQVRLLQSGQVGTYVLLMVIGILALFIVQLFL